jgi:hypothetical protein
LNCGVLVTPKDSPGISIPIFSVKLRLNDAGSLCLSSRRRRGDSRRIIQKVITAQTSLLENRRSVVDILTRRMAASVSLVQALGGGWDAAQLPSSRDLPR